MLRQERPRLVSSGGIMIRAILPPSIGPPLLSVFDAGLVADAGGEKRASRSCCQGEQERSCDPLGGIEEREGFIRPKF